MTELSIRLEVTVRDYEALAKHNAERVSNLDRELARRRGQPLQTIGHTFVVGGAVGLMFHILDGRLHFPSTILTSLLFGGYLMLLVQQRRRLASMPVDDRFFGPKTVHMSNDGIRETCALYDVLCRWSIVESVIRSSEHLFVPVGHSAAFMIPLRTFATAEEQKAFLDAFQTFRSTAMAMQAT